jgi:hypothetical protein
MPLVEQELLIIPEKMSSPKVLMFTEGGHLGWRSGSLDTILKIDHLRTIHAMFALNWQHRTLWKKMFKSSPLKPVSQFKANMG